MGVGVARGQGSSWKNAGGAEDMVTEEDNVSTQDSPPTSRAEHESQSLHSPYPDSRVFLGPASASSAALLVSR